MSLSDISTKFTEKTLDEIIQKAGGTKHTSYQFGEGFKKGDSYLSKVFRLTVYGVKSDGSTLEVPLICKGMPDNIARRKVFHSADFFRNEINFYTKVVPAWEAFQARRKPTNPFTEYPKCYATFCDGENDFIALENVTNRGYGAPNRQEYISLEDALLTMRTLGRFHGTSLAMRALEPENFEKAAKSLEETYYSEARRSWYIGFLGLACNVAIDAVEKTYPASKYQTIVKKFLQPKTLYDDLIKLVSSDSPLAAIGHGDCWTPNFLTRYTKDKQPEAIIIIDFQLARRASIALDISFFIYSCTSEALREAHYEQLLKEYHQSAAALIADLGADVSNVLSWEAFKNEMRQFGRFGCGMGIESLPMSLIDDDEIADLDSMKEDAELTDVWNITPFKEQKKRERVAQIFKHAIDQSYITK
ncbi:uncharacterized protein [Eurosta solidaginis]|uniref:uncharacterized protein n=1 Tax=Eurosta solidaginis TaxID=178769 RepID=UPI0035305C09